jgi:hypothetical protein
LLFEVVSLLTYICSLCPRAICRCGAALQTNERGEKVYRNKERVIEQVQPVVERDIEASHRVEHRRKDVSTFCKCYFNMSLLYKLL